MFKVKIKTEKTERFLFQEEAWRSHVWKKDKSKSSQAPKTKRKFGFREIARFVPKTPFKLQIFHWFLHVFVFVFFFQSGQVFCEAHVQGLGAPHPRHHRFRHGNGQIRALRQGALWRLQVRLRCECDRGGPVRSDASGAWSVAVGGDQYVWQWRSTR